MHRTERNGRASPGSGPDRSRPPVLDRYDPPVRDRTPLPGRPPRAAGGGRPPADPTPGLALERPAFGQFARQVAQVGLDDLAACIADQRVNGGRLGDILCRRGLLDRGQVQEVLRRQAAWVAVGFRADFGGALPYPTSLSVCLPAFNEAENLPDTLDTALGVLPAFVREFEVVVVNDGSRDATADVVREYAARDRRVRLVSHPHNRGYGAAVTTGLRAARGELVMFCDSDGQFSFLDVPHLLRRMATHDVAVGYRYRRADHRVRVFNAACWNRLVRVALGVRVRDLDCAFKMFRRPVLDRLTLSATGAAINAEIMAQVVRGGVRVCEVPVNHYPRYAGAPTGAAIKVIARAFRELPRLLKYRFRPNPLLPAADEPAPPSAGTRHSLSLDDTAVVHLERVQP